MWKESLQKWAMRIRSGCSGGGIPSGLLPFSLEFMSMATQVELQSGPLQSHTENSLELEERPMV
jgi:hypothetical protein